MPVVLGLLALVGGFVIGAVLYVGFTKIVEEGKKVKKYYEDKQPIEGLKKEEDENENGKSK